MPNNRRKQTQRRSRPIKNTRRRNNGNRPERQSGRTRVDLSPAGDQFLKSVTSVCDFSYGACEGIPDTYSGPTLVKNDYLTLPLSLSGPTDPLATQRTWYLIFAPTPGVAYWGAYIDEVPENPVVPNNFTFNSVLFPDTPQLFPNLEEDAEAKVVSNTESVTRYRYIGHAAEIQCMENEMSWKGSIQVWKTPLDLKTTNISNGTLPQEPSTYLEGFEGVLNGSQTYGGTAIKGSSQVWSSNLHAGCYSQSMNRDPQFSFADIRDGTTEKTWTRAPAGNATTTSYANFVGMMLGTGSADSIIMKVSIPKSDNQLSMSLIIKAWHMIEYQPTHGSLLAQFSHISPAYDKEAMCMYRYLHDNLPIAVIQSQNASFWRRVLGLVHGISGGLSILPGQYGTAFKGVNALTGLLGAG